MQNRTVALLTEPVVDAMSAAKDHINQLVSSLPEDSSFDEIVREIAFARMVEKGLADSRAHKTISNEEMNRRIKLWQK